jgi:hypothetical protein
MSKQKNGKKNGATKSLIEPYRLLTSDEAAQFLSVSAACLKTWRFKKIGPPYVKLVANVRYRLEDLSAYAENKTIGKGRR